MRKNITKYSRIRVPFFRQTVIMRDKPCQIKISQDR